MLKIYIARHGQDVDNKNGVLNGHRNKPLTKLGEQQAEKLAKKIKNGKLYFDVIYSSPLKRASKTANIISFNSSKKKPIVLNLLIERNFGIMTGKKINKIEELCYPEIIKTKKITYFLNPKGAETFPILYKRAKKLLIFIKNKHKNQSVLLVTHGDFGKMLYAVFYKLPWKKIFFNFHFGNTEILYLNKGHNLNKTHIFKTKQHNS